MDKSVIRTLVLITFDIVIVAGLVALYPNANMDSSQIAAINATSGYTFAIAMEPLFGLVASVATIFGAIIAAYSYFRKSSEERRWKDVVIK